MVKNIGYYIYALFFHIFRLLPVNGKKVFMVATHDASPEGNIGIVKQEWEKRDPTYRFIMMTRRDGIRHPFHFFIVLPYHMATAAYILEDNIFLPMAYLHFSKKTKIVQLWHGTGTIKRFGQSVNTGRLGKLEYKANQKMTNLIVNSEYTKRIYQQAFAIEKERIQVLGLPRTDLLLSKEYLVERKKVFDQEFPQFINKRIVLYTPTFRDDEVENPSVHIDFAKLNETLPEEAVFLIRLHPHVAASFDDSALEPYQNRIVNVSGYPDVTTLLFAADELITDYSSIIFEYCILERPMHFYAYDLERFESQGRSFYENYASYVPGTIAKSQDELVKQVFNEQEKGQERSRRFKEESFAFVDGKACERLLDLLLHS